MSDVQNNKPKVWFSLLVENEKLLRLSVSERLLYFALSVRRLAAYPLIGYLARYKIPQQSKQYKRQALLDLATSCSVFG